MSGAGFQNDLVFAANADFSGSSIPSASNGLFGLNKIWVGNAGNTIDVVTLTQGSGIAFSKGAGLFTISADVNVPTTFTGNSGTANPALNNINLTGAGSLTTTASGSTVSFALTGLTNHSILVGAGNNTITKVGPSATSGQVLQSAGAAADPVFSTATYPSSSGGTGKILYDNGTNFVESTPTFPASASATTRKIIVSDGTNWVASTETWAVPGTSGNVLTSNGTNWTSAAPATSGTVTSVSGTANQVSVANQTTTPVISLVGPYTPATYTAHGVLIGEGTSSIVALGAGSSGQVLQSGGASADPAYSTATYPATATGTGTLLRADGTNWVATTSTYPNTNAVSTLLYASSANVMSALATANSAILATNSSGVPSITTASGNWNNTSRAEFLAYVSTTIANITGDATTYTIIFDTETSDQGNDFNLGTSVFTAPVTGKYFFDLGVLLGGGTSITLSFGQIVTTAATFQRSAPLAAGAITSCSVQMSGIFPMTAGDTATFTITATDSGGKIDDVSGVSGAVRRTWVSGYLVC